MKLPSCFAGKEEKPEAPIEKGTMKTVPAVATPVATMDLMQVKGIGEKNNKEPRN